MSGQYIHEFKIKLMDTNYRFGFGVTSNIENYKSYKWFYDFVDGESYYVASGYNENDPATARYGIKNSNAINVYKSVFSCDGFKNGDIIKLRLNCFEWSLTYLVNEKQVGKFEHIEPDKVYYIGISLLLRSNLHEFEIEIMDYNHFE